MSRIGKKPIALPDKVKISEQNNTVTVTGPLGSLKLALPTGFSVKVEGNVCNLGRSAEDAQTKALHGLYRSLLNNMAYGVAHGYTKILDIVGVGYKSELKGKVLDLNVGYSHTVHFPVPEGIKITVDKQTRITVNGIDKQLVGETAARIRKVKPPEPYQQKGIRYSDEIVKKKVGKAATAVGGGK